MSLTFINLSQPSGYLLSPLILETFAIYFETTGINTDPVKCKSRPVGALALALAAVSVLFPGIILLPHWCPRLREQLGAG